jgi:hypothetical protein
VKVMVQRVLTWQKEQQVQTDTCPPCSRHVTSSSVMGKQVRAVKSCARRGRDRWVPKSLVSTGKGQPLSEKDGEPLGVLTGCRTVRPLL